MRKPGAKLRKSSVTILEQGPRPPHPSFAAMRVPPAISEYKFHPKRKWRFDWAWPESHLALEIQGGLWNYGRHNRAAGYLRDMEKFREAAILGWRIIMVTPKEVESGLAAELVWRAFDETK